MLDKTSQQVLEHLNTYYTTFGNTVNKAFDGKITLYEDEDAVTLNIPSHLLFLICRELEKSGYLENVSFSDGDVVVSITQKGLSYTKYLFFQKLKYWLPIAIDSFLSITAIIISIIALLV